MATRMQMVEELIALLNPKKMTEALLKQELSSTLGCLSADESTVQEYQAITEFQDAVKNVDMCVFNTYMGSTLLSDHDLKMALRFYASPVGRKLLTERGELQKDAAPFIKRLIVLVAGHFITLIQRKMHMMFMEIIHALDASVSRDDAATLAAQVMQNNPLFPAKERPNATANAVPPVHAGSREICERDTLAQVLEGVFAKMREAATPSRPYEPDRLAADTQPSLAGNGTNDVEHVNVDPGNAVDA